MEGGRGGTGRKGFVEFGGGDEVVPQKGRIYLLQYLATSSIPVSQPTQTVAYWQAKHHLDHRVVFAAHSTTLT